jgi:hypothetical protein
MIRPLPVVLLACSLFAPAARAQAPAPQAEPSILAKLTDIVPPEPGRQACFTRAYDKAHLAQHPRQRVTQLAFLLRATSYAHEGKTQPTKLEERVYYQFALSLKRRGERRALTTAGNCFGGKGISCAVDCDGGGVTLEANGQSLLVRLMEHGIKMEGDCDGKAVWVKPGADDKVFRVEKAAPEACKALAEDLAE